MRTSAFKIKESQKQCDHCSTYKVNTFATLNLNSYLCTEEEYNNIASQGRIKKDVIYLIYEDGYTG